MLLGLSFMQTFQLNSCFSTPIKTYLLISNTPSMHSLSCGVFMWSALRAWFNLGVLRLIYFYKLICLYSFNNTNVIENIEKWLVSAQIFLIHCKYLTNLFIFSFSFNLSKVMYASSINFLIPAFIR